jgi:uncharacterized membrane protein
MSDTDEQEQSRLREIEQLNTRLDQLQQRSCTIAWLCLALFFFAIRYWIHQDYLPGVGRNILEFIAFVMLILGWVYIRIEFNEKRAKLRSRIGNCMLAAGLIWIILSFVLH